MDQQEFAKQLALEAYDEVLTKSLPAKQWIPEHSHPFDAKVLVLSGDVTLGLEGRQTVYREGDIYSVGRGIEHTELYGDAGVSLMIGRNNH